MATPLASDDTSAMGTHTGDSERKRPTGQDSPR